MPLCWGVVLCHSQRIEIYDPPCQKPAKTCTIALSHTHTRRHIHKHTNTHIPCSSSFVKIFIGLMCYQVHISSSNQSSRPASSQVFFFILQVDSPSYQGSKMDRDFLSKKVKPTRGARCVQYHRGLLVAASKRLSHVPTFVYVQA